MSKKKSTATGLGCLFLFALPFAGIGVFMGYRTVTSLADWAAMKSWVEVEAVIQSAELAVSHGDDSTSYQAKATYRYTYEGAEFTGTRVGIDRGSDSVGSFQERAYEEIQAHRGSAFRCYVNPDDPSESVLFRDLRWEMLGFNLLFVILFGGAGFGLMIGGIYGSRRVSRDEELEALHPDEPWLQKEEWQTGRIRSEGKASFLSITIFAVIWNLVSAPAVFFVVQAIRGEQEPVAFVAGLFPLVGIGLAYSAVKSGLRYRKYGDSVFEMSYVPGVIGGPFAGRLRTQATPDPGGGFDVTLSSVGKRRSGSGKNRSTSESVLWQKSARFAYDRSLNGVPVSFHIPYECSPTDGSDADNQILWKLTASAETPGLDYHAEFVVPVFRTEHSSDAPPEAHDDIAAPFRIEVPLDQKVHQAGGRIEDFAGGRRFVFPMARQVGLALGLTFFFLLWTGVVAGLYYSDAPAIFPWLFGLFDVLLFVGVLDLWLHGSRIEIRHGVLSYASGMFGGGRTRTLGRDEIQKIAPKRGMQSGNTLYYQLEVSDRSGKTHTLAKRIPDLETAERLAKELEHRLGLGSD